MVGVLVLWTGAQWSRSAAQPTPPDVVVIMTDDQTVENLRVMKQTKRLIGDAGATFVNSFASYPLCCPSRATFMTGQYAHNHGILGNKPPRGGYELFAPTAHNSLPVWLDAAGYHTLHIGKFLNGYGDRHPNDVPPGWDEWQAAISASAYRMWGFRLNENGYPSDPYGHFMVQDVPNYQTDVYARKAVAAIRQAARSRQKLFLSVAFLAPHSEAGARVVSGGNGAPRPAIRHRGRFAHEKFPNFPAYNELDTSDKPLHVQRYPPMAEDDQLELVARYRQRLESLLAVDDAIARIVGALADTGKLRNTFIFFTSDNGFFHGEHRIPEGKVFPYEPSVRVPLLVRGPGIPAGAVSREYVANIDLAPTVVDATGATAGRALDGRSLIPFAKDPRKRTTRPILLETGRDALSEAERKLQKRPGDPASPAAMLWTYQAIRTPRYKYVEYINGEQELYDLAFDPAEEQSMHFDPRYLETKAALARWLDQLRRCAGSACGEAMPPGTIPSPPIG